MVVVTLGVEAITNLLWLYDDFNGGHGYDSGRYGGGDYDSGGYGGGDYDMVAMGVVTMVVTTMGVEAITNLLSIMF